MKKSEKKEELSRELLKVLRTDRAYRQFTAAHGLQKQAGEEIARIRKRRKLTARDLAIRIGRKEQDIARMERGEFKQYTLKLLLQIADATDSGIRIEFV
jgi:ribosome-binding protein aMBF1 (putative translation factor)